MSHCRLRILIDRQRKRLTSTQACTAYGGRYNTVLSGYGILKQIENLIQSVTTKNLRATIRPTLVGEEKYRCVSLYISCRE